MSLSTANEQITFTDEQFATNISAKLLKFYKEEEFFDIELIAGNDSIKIQAHKIVLSAASDYFVELFRRNPATNRTFEIKEIEGSSLKLIVDFMYSGSIGLNSERIESILRSAVILKMKNLVHGCCAYLKKNNSIRNCLRSKCFWLNFASELRLTELRKQCFHLIYKNFEQATKETEFLLLNVTELKDLLFKNNTYTDLEEQVFLSLVAWIEYDKVNREHLLLELLSMIRYRLLTSKFITENRKLVCKTVEHCDLIIQWLQYHLSSDSRTDEEKKSASTLTSETKVVVERVAEASKKVDRIGGIFFNSRMEIELRSYNQVLKKWSIEKRLPPQKENISQYSMIVINYKLFVVGGIINERATKSVKCLDLKTFKWTDLPLMQVARCDSQLANLNGNLCVFGGFADSKHTIFIDSVVIFNTSTQKWKDIQPLNKPKVIEKIAGHNGILYIFDFRYGCLQCYDVSTDKWTSMDQPIDDDVNEVCFTGVDNYLYAIFIARPYFGCTRRLRTSVKRFDLSKNSWSEMDKLPENDYAVKMVTLIGNKILFPRYRDMVEYNLETHEFSFMTTVYGSLYLIKL